MASLPVQVCLAWERSDCARRRTGWWWTGPLLESLWRKERRMEDFSSIPGCGPGDVSAPPLGYRRPLQGVPTHHTELRVYLTPVPPYSLGDITSVVDSLHSQATVVFPDIRSE